MILSFNKQRRASGRPPASVAASDPGSVPALDAAVVRDFAQQASGIGREAAEMLGFIDDLGAAAKNQSDAFWRAGIGADCVWRIDSDHRLRHCVAIASIAPIASPIAALTQLR